MGKSNVVRVIGCLIFLVAISGLRTDHLVAVQIRRAAGEQTLPYAWFQDSDSYFRQPQTPEPNSQMENCFNCSGGWDGESWITFAGIEGSKQPQDLGVNAHVGGRLAVNYGRLLSDAGSILPLPWCDIGIQFGTSINATANAVQVVERIEGSTSRIQSFSTIGLFLRPENGMSWGIGYDFLYQDYFDTAFLGQWRMEIWQPILERDEVGVTVALRDRGDEVFFLGDRFELNSLSYARFNWRRYWESGAFTTVWIGWASSHSEINVALGDLPGTGRQFLFGSDFRCPLNSFLSLYGEANFVMPGDTGSVDAFLGIEFCTHARGSPVSSFKSRPVLPLAGSPTFIVNATR